MKTFKKLFVLSLCLVQLNACTVSNQPSLQENPTYHIGVVLKTMDSEHWNEIQSGMQNAADTLGLSLTILYPTTEWAEAEQNILIEDLLQTDIDALIIAPCNSTNTRWVYQETKARGIVLYTADTRSLDSDIPYVGIDNVAAGQMAADYLRGKLGASAQLAVIAGATQQAQTIDRVGAFCKQATNVHAMPEVLVSKENSGYEDAIVATQGFLAQGVQGVFCASAVMGLGAATASTEAAQPLCIVTIDTQDDALRALQNGKIDALITQSGYDIGQTAVQTVAKVLDGHKMGTVYLKSELLTKDTVDAFLVQGGTHT